MTILRIHFYILVLKIVFHMKLSEYMVTTGQRWVKDDIIFVHRY
jgi:hypothetical protein